MNYKNSENDKMTATWSFGVFVSLCHSVCHSLLYLIWSMQEALNDP